MDTSTYSGRLVQLGGLNGPQFLYLPAMNENQPFLAEDGERYSLYGRSPVTVLDSIVGYAVTLSSGCREVHGVVETLSEDGILHLERHEAGYDLSEVKWSLDA